MTSEVVLMNRLAVALAADSAVTIPTGSGQKVFQSWIKLFALSKHHPVGVMTYSNANILDVPLETIIKVYREKLGARSFPRIVDYANDFVDFLNNNTAFFTKKSQDVYYLSAVRAFFSDIAGNARKTYFDAVVSGKPPEMSEHAKAAIDKFHGKWTKLENLQCFSRQFSGGIKKKYSKDVQKITQEIFENMGIDDESNNKLVDLAIWLMTKDEFEEGYSGIVFAGFGEDEIYPAMCSFRVSNVINQRVKQRKEEHYEIGDEWSAVVLPIAQSDMIRSFTNGINPKYWSKIVSQSIRLALGFPKTLIDSITDLKDEQKNYWKNKSVENIKSVMDNYFDEISKYQFENHTEPVYSAIRSLPKDELADAAEALVNLSSFQKRVSLEDETVAGPIDVAVISKGDGFIWIKRKHYFEPEMNYQFFKNYYRNDGRNKCMEEVDESIVAATPKRSRGPRESREDR